VSTLARALSWFLQPAAQRPDEPSRPAAATEITSAAVLGRPGEAEPVAAALAVALTRHADTRAATVAILAPPLGPTVAAVHPRAGGGWVPPAGEAPPPLHEWRPPAGGSSPADAGSWSPTPAGNGASPVAGGWSPPASSGGAAPEPPGRPAGSHAAGGGSRAARRLAARLDAHGLPARSRGRLAWVALPAAEGAAAARRAVVAGAPAVLAITAPRTAELDDVVAEQDLVILVAAEPDGPLARLAALPEHAPPLVVVRPLRRGPVRSLACAGLAAPREIRALLGARRREAS
jgi:hypothetical protein